MMGISYSRVSLDKQAQSGLGIKAQQAALAGLALQHGIEFVAQFCDEGESAKDTDRPELQKGLAMLERGQADTLFVAKFDRLSRSVIDAAQLIDRFKRMNWGLVIGDLGVDTTTPMGELVANMMASVAQWERRVIGQRTSEAMMRLPRARRGRPPYGFKRQGDDFVVLVEEQTILWRIKGLAASGQSVRKIAKTLNALGARGRKGGPWSHTMIHRILKRTSCELPANFLRTS
jgi:DNA invertase Pin-like site-specific DNA recombinase